MISNLTAESIEQSWNLAPGSITLQFSNTVPSIKGADEATNARLLTCWQAGTLAPDAQAWQVRAYLIRQGISPARITDLLTSATAEGPEREEALMRWDYVTQIPKSYPLVRAVAQELGLDLETVWWRILEIQ